MITSRFLGSATEGEQSRLNQGTRILVVLKEAAKKDPCRQNKMLGKTGVRRGADSISLFQRLPHKLPHFVRNLSASMFSLEIDPMCEAPKHDERWKGIFRLRIR